MADIDEVLSYFCDGGVMVVFVILLYDDFFFNWDSLHAKLTIRHGVTRKEAQKKITGYRKSV